MPDANEDISLLAVLKEGKFEASLITTFNATLPFYEEVVLRRLRASGSMDNVVLMDSVQCARSWATPSLRPRMAGALYTLIPVVAPGAFHPKICLLAAKKRCVLFVGSHNVTLSGFGFNREVTTIIDVRPDSDPAHRLVLSHAWSLISEWLRTQEGGLAPSVLNAARNIAKFIPAANNPKSNSSDIRLLGQSSNGPSLLDQLGQAIAVAPERVVVTGAFFDTRHAFLKKLEALWPEARIKVVIDPTTVKLGARPSGLRTRFVDARGLWPDKADRYLHAKALLLDFGSSHTLVAGSANPSGPAWLAGVRCNFEAMLLRPDIELGSSTFASDLAQAFRARDMNETELRAIPVTRQDDENDSGEPGVSIRVTALPVGATSIAIPALVALGFSEVVMYLEDGTGTDPMPIGRAANGDGVIDLGSHAATVRWLELRSRGKKCLRVIIHHDELLGRSRSPSNRSALRDALDGLDFGGANIQALVAEIEKAIFDDPEQIIAPIGHAGSAGAPPQQPTGEARPPSLAVRTGGGTGHSKGSPKRRLLQEGSLLDVLDALLYRLGQGLPSSPSLIADTVPVSEEELVGNEDEGAADQPAEPPQRDAVIALRKKLKKIVHRMIRQLKLARHELKAELRDSKARSALVQLVAVLSLMREFRRLRHMPQWRPMGGFVDAECRQNLLSQAMSALFDRHDGIARLVNAAGSDEPAELGQARALLAWLAWDVGHSLLKRINPLAPTKSKDELVRAYLYIYELLPRIVVDEEDEAYLESSVRMTAKPTADEGAKSEEWLRHHKLAGMEVATAPPAAYDDREDLKAGDLLRIPHLTPPRLSVVVEADAETVRLIEFEGECSFKRFAWKMASGARMT